MDDLTAGAAFIVGVVLGGAYVLAILRLTRRDRGE